MDIFNNTIMAFMPAYTTREIRNYGFFKANSLYKYLFTPEDKLLIETGAIKLFPLSMCDFFVTNDVTFSDKKYKTGEQIDVANFDDNTLKVLLKTKVLKCQLKEEFNSLSEDEIIIEAKLYDYIGKTFKELAESLSLDFSFVKEKFELKQGASKKKIAEGNLPLIKELLNI